MMPDYEGVPQSCYCPHTGTIVSMVERVGLWGRPSAPVTPRSEFVKKSPS